ncbi:metalloregulator ArsR/SmtB family transcription factor [Necropsobacter rosorum]|uniref:ArsR/SmtB family transcription factor n=1 Tax=Necropsobacter rosorum TaxID=908285 RepID=UPI000509B45A
MNTEYASQLFESLSSPIRLAIFQTLMREGRQGIVAGDLAKMLNLAPNKLSFHLKILSQSGLITSQNEGRFIRYYANLDLMMKLVGFLTENCCQNGQDEHCSAFCCD